MKRPTSLTVVSILMMVLGGFGVFGAFNTMRLMNDPAFAETMEELGAASSVPIPAQIAMSFAGTLVLLVSGVAIFKGLEWGRWLYIGWTLLGLVVSLITAPTMFVFMIPSLIFTAILAFFLFRPAATAYFRRDGSTDEPSA